MTEYDDDSRGSAMVAVEEQKGRAKREAVEMGRRREWRVEGGSCGDGETGGRLKLG